MPNTFTQIYIQVVFAVKNRQALIHNDYEDELFKYIAGIIRNGNQKLFAINGIPDHIHIFIGIHPNIALSDLVRDVKNSSSKFLNSHRLVSGNFNWQEGFGAFSYSHSQIDAVVKYIQRQKLHHTKQPFREEYLDMLKKLHINYDEKYLFEWIDQGAQ
ncbi:MAG: IS200/IS605 family transposase [Candidatus Zhuqueibacterota bacterium]